MSLPRAIFQSTTKLSPAARACREQIDAILREKGFRLGAWGVRKLRRTMNMMGRTDEEWRELLKMTEKATAAPPVIGPDGLPWLLDMTDP